MHFLTLSYGFLLHDFLLYLLLQIVFYKVSIESQMALIQVIIYISVMKSN